jgi:hypothetical protein
MATIRTLQFAFNRGEISPEMLGRIDDGQTGLAKCLNFIARPQGPVENRSGFRFVRAAKYAHRRVRLIPFTFSISQTMVIEVGHEYFRFHTKGATLLVDDESGNPYEITSPYQEEDLIDIGYAQKEDVLTIVHQNYPPMELRRYGATDWRLERISFLPPVDPPSSITVTRKNQSGTQFLISYVVTSVTKEGIESIASVVAAVNGNLFENGASNEISWGAVSGTDRYIVYKQLAGVFGYIGQTETLSVIDDNIAPDMSKTPPIYDDVFNAPDDYPGAVTYFEQRRCFAGTRNNPQRIWMTRSGTDSVMSYGRPLREDDRIDKAIASLQVNAILHMVPLPDLVLLTASSEFAVTSVTHDAVTHSSFNARQQSQMGASKVHPIIANNIIVYCASRGGHVLEVGYQYEKRGYVPADMSLRASHLFDYSRIVDMSFEKAPIPTAWCVTSKGKLLGATYIPEQQIGAWHQHETDGKFESCCVVAEGDDDVLYVSVCREIEGEEVRYIEMIVPRLFDRPEEAFFVDSGLSYDGDLATVFSGLEHLEGKTVSIIGDGAVFPRQVVKDGSVEIDHPARRVHVGLPYVSEIETLPIVAQVDGAYGQGRAKNVNRVFMRVVRSSGIWAGPSANALREYKQRTTEPPGSPPRLKTDEIEIMAAPSWGNSGSVVVRQLDPLPLTILNLCAEVATGG